MPNNHQHIPLLEPEAKSTLGYVVHQWDNRHKRNWSLSPLKNYNSQWQATWAVDVQLHYVACNVNYSWFSLSINNIYIIWVSFYFWLGPECLNSLSRPWQILFSRARLGTWASAASLLTRCQHTRDKLIATEQRFVKKNLLANKKRSTNLFFCRRSKISKWEFKESRIIPLARPLRLFPWLMLHHFQPPLLRSCTDSASHGYSHYAPRTCVTGDGCCVATQGVNPPYLQTSAIEEIPSETSYY